MHSVMGVVGSVDVDDDDERMYLT